jgi:hypothetical protein
LHEGQSLDDGADGVLCVIDAHHQVLRPPSEASHQQPSRPSRRFGLSLVVLKTAQEMVAREHRQAIAGGPLDIRLSLHQAIGIHDALEIAAGVGPGARPKATVVGGVVAENLRAQEVVRHLDRPGGKARIPRQLVELDHCRGGPGNEGRLQVAVRAGAVVLEGTLEDP